VSVPVGCENMVDMYPLDFEKFLWANGINSAIIDRLQKCLSGESPVSEALHQRMRQLLLQYVVVGGMPVVVNLFIDNHNMGRVLAEQSYIFFFFTGFTLLISLF
jgi:uncharacterized protein